MKKTISIGGMSCGHCKARVEEYLNKIEGVRARVDLKKNKATIKSKVEIDDKLLIAAVTEAGFEVLSVSQ
jgi:copper chaperone CopZ